MSHFSYHHPPPTEIYTLSLHDALPISPRFYPPGSVGDGDRFRTQDSPAAAFGAYLRHIRSEAIADIDHRVERSEEHTSELQSRGHLVCRLLLEKKNK